MTRKEAIEYGKDFLSLDKFSKDTNVYQFFDMAIQALEQEPCEDAISREDVLDKIQHAEINFTITSNIDFSKYKKEIQEIIDHIVEAQTNAIKQLPSVTPMSVIDDIKAEVAKMDTLITRSEVLEVIDKCIEGRKECEETI